MRETVTQREVVLIECKSASHSKDEAPYLAPACIHVDCIEDTLCK